MSIIAEERTLEKGESQVSIPDQLPIKSSTTPSLGSSYYKLLREERAKIAVRRVKSKKLIEVLKPTPKVKKRYFTAGYGITDENQRRLDLEPSPFHYPRDMEVFAHHVMTKAWRNDERIKELTVKCSQKPSFKDKQKRDLLHRLYVPEPKVETLKTILDIDPDYFKTVEGRPIPDKLNIRDYIDVVRDTLRTKIVVGYREDDIMLIQETLLLEEKIIDTIQNNYNKYVNVFEEFLFIDHTTSMRLLKESEAAAAKAYEKYMEYKGVAKRFAALRSSLYNSEEKWKNCKMYEKFLYLVSPFSWRKDQEYLRQKYESSLEEKTSENLFDISPEVDEQQTSLTDLLRRFQEDCQTTLKPVLFFTDPEELLDVFRYIELQNLYSLLHSEELAIPIDQVSEGMLKATEMFDEEIRGLEEKIEKLEGGIRWEEERAKYLEELALKLIGNEFKKLVMDDDILNLEVFVEDVYEIRIGPNDANLTIGLMMQAIEAKYRHELLFLDMIPPELVAMLEGSCYMEEVMVMRLAETAAKQFAELESLTFRLNRAIAPAYVKPKGKEPKKRSKPKEPPKICSEVVRSLTGSEVEYLDYFTDYCKYTDDPATYGIQTHQVVKVKGPQTVEFTDEDHLASTDADEGTTALMDIRKSAIFKGADQKQ